MKTCRLLGAACLFAIQCLTSSAAPGPQEAALADFRAGRFASAWEAFHSLSGESMDRGSQANAAVAARLCGMHEEALASRRQAGAFSDESGWNRMWAARILMAQGRYGEALVELGAPRNAWEHLTRSQILRRTGDAEGALLSCSDALSLDPLLYVALQERGEIMEALGRNEEGLLEYSTALELDRSLVHLHPRMAEMERKIGRTRESYDRLVRFLLVDPRNPAALRLKSALSQEFPQYATAEKAKEREKELDWLKLSAPLFSPLPPTPVSPIRVGVVSDVDAFRIKCAGTLFIESGGGLLAVVPPQTQVEGSREGSRMRISWPGGSLKPGHPVLLRPADRNSSLTVFDVHFAQGYFWSEKENRPYRGSIQARRFGKGLSLVNVVPLEDYLLSVVPAEMPSGWPLEALKAQAVAARGETLSKLRRHSAEGFDVCASQHCAVYRGMNGEADNSSRAIIETRGEVMFTGGKPMPAVYADNCGGRGSSAEEVWGSSNADLPAVSDIDPREARGWRHLDEDPDLRERFIFSRPRAYCNQPKRPASAFRWVRSYSFDEISSWLDRRYSIGRLKSADIRAVNAQGWVIAVEFTGEKGTKLVERDAIRGAFGMIKSNFFTIEALPASGLAPAQLILYGCGWGHGVGMCQTGAYGLAVSGKDWRQILRHYYPAARLKRIY